jgi:hypothetical protein
MVRVHGATTSGASMANALLLGIEENYGMA